MDNSILMDLLNQLKKLCNITADINLISESFVESTKHDNSFLK